MFNTLLARLSTRAGLGRPPAMLGVALLITGSRGVPRGPPAGTEGFSISRRYSDDWLIACSLTQPRWASPLNLKLFPGPQSLLRLNEEKSKIHTLIPHAPRMPQIKRHSWGQIKQHKSKCFPLRQRDAAEGFRARAVGTSPDRYSSPCGKAGGSLTGWGADFYGH